LGIFVLVAVLHVLAILGLVRAFAPEFTASVTSEVAQALRVVTITAPPPPPPSPTPSAPEPAGASGEEGRKAVPREVSAPVPKIRITERPAPRVASTGDANTSGARDTGTGTGAGGTGSGPGSGDGGSGQGGGGASKPVKIAGDINSARDYPKGSREARLGDHVVIALTVGTDGRVKGCRVQRPSRDPEADRITCRLATERFRFRPATDRTGEPVEAVYGWQQRWFVPGENK